VLPLALSLGLLCGVLAGAAAGLAAAAALCVTAYAATQRRKEAMLALKLGGARSAGSGSLLDRLSSAEAAWLQASSAQQLGQIRVNPSLMSVEILRERICRSCELISLPHATADRYELFIGTSPAVRMDPEHAIGVYAVHSKLHSPYCALRRRRSRAAVSVCFSLSYAVNMHAVRAQEPGGEIVVELCLRVALLDERQYQPHSPKESCGNDSGSTVAEPRRQHAGHGQQGRAPLQRDARPGTYSGTGAVSPAGRTGSPGPAVTPDRDGQRTEGAGRSTPGPQAAAGEAMLTPNAHAMNAEQAAKLRSMLHEISPGAGAPAAAAFASPAASPLRASRVADALACGDTATTPQRQLESSPPAAAGLSAAEIQKMRGMLQQALASPPPGSPVSRRSEK
jgi:hypothetical protein